MSYVEKISERAKNFLTTGWMHTAGKGSSRSSFRVSPELVLDHSLRVQALARMLSQDLIQNGGEVDDAVVTACALFHDAGWVEQVRRGVIAPGDVFSYPADADLLQAGAVVAKDQLANLLPDRMLKKIEKSILELKHPHPVSPEGIVVADADNLEEFGLLGVLNQARAAQANGKSPVQLIESWHRQQEYRYWEARINNALHLDRSKIIAQQRLKMMGRIFDLLLRELNGKDVQDSFSPNRIIVITNNTTV